MAELAPGDLPPEVMARFADDDDAQAAIDTALVAARRYCGWHVSPVNDDESFVLDGPGGRLLSLPTLKLNSVTSVTEGDCTVDLSTVDVSERKGTITKRFWWWTCRDGAITAVITHGFTETEAADWRRAIVLLVDARSYISDERDDPDMKLKRVSGIEYEWFENLMSNDAELAATFSQFRILPSP